MKPSRSTLNWPLRVKVTRPLLSVIWKNPAPLIARSMGFSVVMMLPWVNCCETEARLVPMPTELAPAPLSAAAYTSLNSARDTLAP